MSEFPFPVLRFAVGADPDARHEERKRAARVARKRDHDEGIAFQMRQAGDDLYGCGPAGVFLRAAVFAKIEDDADEKRRQAEIERRRDERVVAGWARGGPRSHQDILMYGSSARPAG